MNSSAASIACTGLSTKCGKAQYNRKDMDPALTTTIVSTGGPVIVGVFGMFFTANQIGRRIDNTNQNLRDLRAEFTSFKDMVSSKFAALDLEIAKLMDKR
jgi:hypothetical protein